MFEIWTECLERSGGPYLFGEHFGIPDAMYFPVLTRFRTYGIELPTTRLQAYAEAMESTPVVGFTAAEDSTFQGLIKLNAIFEVFAKLLDLLFVGIELRIVFDLL